MTAVASQRDRLMLQVMVSGPLQWADTSAECPIWHRA
jgi:hypothetical protein